MVYNLAILKSYIRQPYPLISIFVIKTTCLYVPLFANCDVYCTNMYCTTAWKKTLMLSDSLVVQGPDKSGPQLLSYFLLGLQNGVK